MIRYSYPLTILFGQNKQSHFKSGHFRKMKNKLHGVYTCLSKIYIQSLFDIVKKKTIIKLVMFTDKDFCLYKLYTTKHILLKKKKKSLILISFVRKPVQFRWSVQSFLFRCGWFVWFVLRDVIDSEFTVC